MENDSDPWYHLLWITGIHVSSHLYRPWDSLGGAAMKFNIQKYDYYLMVLTIIVLFAVGLLCVYGVFFYNYLAVNPQWQDTIEYTQFIDAMNSYLFPLLVLLLIILGLCIPKRLLKQDILIIFSAVILALTLVLAALSGIETGLGFILAVMTGIQGIVLIMTIKKSGTLRFEKEGYTARLGSSLLHFGLVILIFNFVALRENPLHISIFWGGTLLITAGNIFSFYPERISSILIPK